ncbi:hypothetical protein C7212DRAFT_341066 [Tuber magnatum]|uniref:G domain-containing protein n=1 Tax=Tuber magnatum TaxID=42249 RepID=A0A317SZP8_9PEZI|nr:hypothetical protein C7212DRAFT_341066 [Tuber magnatum]
MIRTSYLNAPRRTISHTGIKALLHYGMQIDRSDLVIQIVDAALAKQSNGEYWGIGEGEGPVGEREGMVVEEKKKELRIRILTVDELEEGFLEHTPIVRNEDLKGHQKTQIGLVGYLNIGKSSTTNTAIDENKVSISSTPRKTKHFQTFHFGGRIVLCHCPSPVFPKFASMNTELVCNGSLPIDQLRMFSDPTTLFMRWIP